MFLESLSVEKQTENKCGISSVGAREQQQHPPLPRAPLCNRCFTRGLTSSTRELLAETACRIESAAGCCGYMSIAGTHFKEYKDGETRLNGYYSITITIKFIHHDIHDKRLLIPRHTARPGKLVTVQHHDIYQETTSSRTQQWSNHHVIHCKWPKLGLRVHASFTYPWRRRGP